MNLNFETNNPSSIFRFVGQLNNVREDHRSLVLVTNGYLELLVEALVRAKCKDKAGLSEKDRGGTYAQKLKLLKKSGVIPDSHYQVLIWFSKLRNRAAHDPFFEVTQADIDGSDFEDLRNARALYGVCHLLIGGFWNSHIEIFEPLFARSLEKK